jgi:hypothetical protein
MLVVVGGGPIGLEMAVLAVKEGMEVLFHVHTLLCLCFDVVHGPPSNPTAHRRASLVCDQS